MAQELREHFRVEKMFFPNQEKWAIKYYWEVWDDICLAFGAMDNQPGPWFHCTEAAKRIKHSASEKTKGNYVRYVMRVALERVDPDDPSIERIGTRYRFLPPKR